MGSEQSPKMIFKTAAVKCSAICKTRNAFVASRLQCARRASSSSYLIRAVLTVKQPVKVLQMLCETTFHKSSKVQRVIEISASHRRPAFSVCSKPATWTSPGCLRRERVDKSRVEINVHHVTETAESKCQGQGGLDYRQGLFGSQGHGSHMQDTGVLAR